MPLTSNYYDFVRHQRPYVLQCAEADAQDILAGSKPPSSVATLDGHAGRYRECLAQIDREVLGTLAEDTGEPVEVVRQQLDDPKMRSRLAAFHEVVAIEYRLLLNFFLAGRRTYRVADAIAECFAYTEPQVPALLASLPATTCLFVYTSPVVVNELHNISRPGVALDERAPDRDYSAPVSVFATITAVPGGRDKALSVTAWHARVPGQHYVLLQRELVLRAGQQLPDAIRSALDPQQAARAGAAADTVAGITVAARPSYAGGAGFLRIVLDSMLYLLSDRPDVRFAQSEKHDLEARAHSLSLDSRWNDAFGRAVRFSVLNYHDLGRTVAPLWPDRNRGTGSSGSSRPAPLPAAQRPAVVKGGWKVEGGGSDRDPRRLVFVRPTLRGGPKAFVPAPDRFK